MSTARSLRPVGEEFEGADLGDERRNSRLLKIAEALERDPAGGFPRAMRSDAELEAFYRFINNGSFNADEIWEPHLEATLERACEVGEVLAIHDSSYFQPAKDAPRKEMGIKTANRGSGFVAHVSLLTTTAGTPLGIGHLETLVRTGVKGRTSAGKQADGEEGKATQRWIRSMQTIEEERGGSFEVIHLVDAEGDFFGLLAAMRKVGARFVVRAAHLDRIVTCEGGDESLRQVVDGLKPQTWRNIPLSERRYNERLRGPHSRRRHPQRDARQARVAIASSRIVIPATSKNSGDDAPVSVNVVRVWEPKPPKGQPPVEWILLTTESIQSSGALLKVVDLYRKRWVIEDFFKALKTGCSLQKRQVASYAALQKVLALLAPIAYRLLLLRGLHRESSEGTPARVAFDPIELVLIAQAQRRPTKTPKTLHEALMLLARIGGHIRNNGPPGWMTLGAGYETLLTLKLGWYMGRASVKK